MPCACLADASLLVTLVLVRSHAVHFFFGCLIVKKTQEVNTNIGVRSVVYALCAPFSFQRHDVAPRRPHSCQSGLATENRWTLTPDNMLTSPFQCAKEWFTPIIKRNNSNQPFLFPRSTEFTYVYYQATTIQHVSQKNTRRRRSVEEVAFL